MVKWQVVLVPFPFDDMTSSKVRPAVCLTNPIGPHQHIVLAFISSQTPIDLLDTDLALESTRVDFSATGLRVNSVLRLHRLMTVSGSFVKRSLGEVSPRIQDEIIVRLRNLFGLA